MLLENKVALVTGSASGIGRASAELFAKQGAQVSVTGLAEDGGHETVKRINAAGGDSIFLKADIGKMSEVEGLVDAATQHYGRIDVLFSNACHYPEGKAADVPEEDWDRVISVCLKATWMLAKQTLPGMVKRGGGTIVVTGSVHSFFGFTGTHSYDIAKAGLLGLVRNIALDYAPTVRINAVLPGAVETGLWDHLGPEEREKIAKGLPLQRNGQPEDIAQAALFLASDMSSYITGTHLTVDGGQTCGFMLDRD